MTRTIEEIEEAFRTSPMVILTAEEKKLWNSYCSINRSSNVQKQQHRPSIAEVLAERGSRYGAFKEHAAITQCLKEQMKQGRRWVDLSFSQREALEMVVHKIGRILNGDPNYLDSWVGIVGYTQLVIDELQEIAK